MENYPALQLFFGAYMYESWRDEFPDEWAAADAFVRAEPHLAPQFHGEMAQLLAHHPDEEAVRRILLSDFGAAAMVENLGWKYRDWMQAMADHVEQAVGHPRAS